MIGRRVIDEKEPDKYEPGDYGKWQGDWYGRPPNNANGDSSIGCYKYHKVEEHEDRTITVVPSILQRWRSGEEIWHGWLRAGVWSVA